MDYYSILGVTKDASSSDITKAYRNLVKTKHPDKGGSEEEFKKISEAYDILSDPVKRQKYDNPMPESSSSFDPTSFFGQFARHQGQQQFHQSRDKIKPVEIIHEVTLEEVFTGVTVTKEYERDLPCPTCKETGYVDCVDRTCARCNGTKVFVRLVPVGPGFMHPVNERCPCSFEDNNEKCHDCNGNKYIRKLETITFTIPKGVKNRKVITIPLVGHESKGSRGPVIIMIQQKDHPIFNRNFSIGHKKTSHLDLLITVELSFVESLCGFKREITQLDGNKFILHETKITQDDSIKVLPGKGLEHKSKTYIKGNLYINFKVKYPDQLDDKQRRLIYFALTGQEEKEEEYDNNTIYLNTKEIDELNNTFEEQHQEHNMPQHIQCAQQ